MKLSELLSLLLEAGDQLKIFHWGTSKYSEHVALGELYDAIIDTTDSIAESGMGASGRQKLAGDIKIQDYVEGASSKYLDALAKELSALCEDDNEPKTVAADKKEDEAELGHDIVNMVQDLLGKVNKTRYLLTLS